MTLCGSDFIVCLYGEVTDAIQVVMLRAQAFTCGVPMLLCANGYACVANVFGGLEFASPSSPSYWDLSIRKEYHLIETRRKGLCMPVVQSL